MCERNYVNCSVVETYTSEKSSSSSDQLADHQQKPLTIISGLLFCMNTRVRGGPAAILVCHLHQLV